MNRTEELFTLAKADLKSARLMLYSGNDELLQNNAAYHVQQALEKTAKAIIEHAGEHLGTVHDIGFLLNLMKSLSISYPNWLEESAYDISKWATTIRYNANFKTDYEEIDSIMKKRQNGRQKPRKPAVRNLAPSFKQRIIIVAYSFGLPVPQQNTAPTPPYLKTDCRRGGPAVFRQTPRRATG